MNHIEYKEVLKTVGINNPLSRTIGGDGSMVDVHYWNELAIWFEGKYAIINGKIPIDVANTIYEKYPVVSQQDLMFVRADELEGELYVLYEIMYQDGTKESYLESYPYT